MTERFGVLHTSPRFRAIDEATRRTPPLQPGRNERRLPGEMVPPDVFMENGVHIVSSTFDVNFSALRWYLSENPSIIARVEICETRVYGLSKSEAFVARSRSSHHTISKSSQRGFSLSAVNAMPTLSCHRHLPWDTTPGAVQSQASGGGSC